jgi:hypothetical protein
MVGINSILINKILIWEHPIPSERVKYGGSLDTSDGLGEDISDDAVIEIFKKEQFLIMISKFVNLLHQKFQKQ